MSGLSKCNWHNTCTFTTKTTHNNMHAYLVKTIARVVIVCIYTGVVYGQHTPAPRVQVERFSIEQGLSDRTVKEIVQDQQGFIWIATDNGLNRFDGYGFLNYDARPRNRHKIGFNKIRTIFQDKSGQLLLQYEDPLFHQPDLLNPLTGVVNSLDLLEKEKTDGNYVAYYQAPDSDLFFLLQSGEGRVSIFRWEEKTRQISKMLETRLPGLRSSCFVSFLRASDGTFWLGFICQNDEQPLLMHTDASGRTIRIYDNRNILHSPKPGQARFQLVEKAPGEMLLSIFNSGVFITHPATDTVFKPHPQLPTVGYSLTQDKRGNLLAFKSNPENPATGCYVLTTDGQILDYSWLFSYQAKIGPVFSEDFTQGLFAGSGDGFHVYHLYPDRFRMFLNMDLGNEPYGMSMRGMAKLGKDRLIVASELSGLFELNLKTGVISRPGDRSPQLSRLNELTYVRNILTQGDSILWMGNWYGVLKYNVLRNRLSFFRTSKGAYGVTPNEISGLAFGKSGKIWVIARDGHLFQMDPASGQMSLYRNRDGTEPLEKSQPSFILTGRDGTVWAGTSLAGLIKIDPQTGASTRFTANAGDPSGFDSNAVSCIHEDESGMLWVGTLEGGLHVFDPKKGKVVAIYSRENGLRNNSTVGILPDDQGNYWVSTYSGLSYFDTRRKTFRNYTVADGLSHNEFNRFSYFFDKDYRQFYFGGMNGVNVFDQKDPRQVQNDAPLLISEMTVTGLKDSLIVRQEGILDGSRVVLEPGSRSLLLRLALGNYDNPEGNQFSYKIDGLDKDWNYLGANRELRIDHLPAGEYVMHVRGADNRGNWSRRQITLYLEAREFWYRRWWAWLLYAGIIGAGVFYFYRFQLRRRIAEKETQRLQQLDAFKTRFFTNISHEFRTPLTVILGMVEPLKKHFSKGSQTAHDQAADMISRNSRQLLTLVNQLLDLSRLEAGKLQLSPSNGDLAAMLQYQLESFHSYAETRHITLHFRSDRPHLDMAFDREKIQTIFVNLISNALKFTPEGGRIELELRTEQNGDFPERVVASVRDTGIGIPEDQLPRIFDRFYQVDDSMTRKVEGTGIGLALVQELVKLMQGTITVESKPGEGTTFKIVLPFTPPHSQLQTVGEMPTPSVLQPEVEDVKEDADERPLLLLVEDNPDVRFYIAECVRHEYRVATAGDGAEGIEKGIALVPDIIISDVMMPEKDGFDLCETLKNDERTSHIPIVLLTARADFDSRIAGLKRGADDYLAKPFEPGELQVRLNNLVQLRRRLQQRYAGLPPLAEPSEDPALVLEDTFLIRIRSVVEAHLSVTDFDMPQLERALGMSRSQVFRKVKALTGASPSLLIRSIRLHKAKELLRDPELSIAEVAYEVGFSTPAYFSTTFLEAFGKTPSEWRLP